MLQPSSETTRLIEQALASVSQPVDRDIAEIDLSEFRQYIDDPSLSPEKQDQILNALWSIINTFVDLGFGVHPVQQACGQAEIHLDRSGNSESNEVRSNQTRLGKESKSAPET